MKSLVAVGLDGCGKAPAINRDVQFCRLSVVNRPADETQRGAKLHTAIYHVCFCGKLLRQFHLTCPSDWELLNRLVAAPSRFNVIMSALSHSYLPIDQAAFLRAC